MTRVYLAARYSRLEEMNQYAEQLRALGYTVDARWLLGSHQLHEGAEEVEAATESISMQGQLFAQDDLDDLEVSNIVICFTEKPRSPESNSRGGRHVELGLALMWNHIRSNYLSTVLPRRYMPLKEILIVGPRENIFYCLPEIKRQFNTWSECYAYLKP